MDATGTNSQRWRDPDRCYPEYPEGSVIEIRVHGVGGEPPSVGTRDPHPVRVGGDDLAGFHRARNPVVGAAGPSTDRTRRQPLHVREVLAWGGQTSGTVRHAFWVVLLPFALFNLAGRMHVTGSSRRAARHRATCRVLALTMTLASVGLLCALAVDLIAVQCAAWGEACLGGAGEGRLLLAPLRRFSTDVVGRLGLAAVLPTLLLVALWYAGRYGAVQLEGSSETGRRHVRRHDEPTSLSDRDFWRNAWPASRLRGLHATAALAWIAGVLAASVHLVHRDLGADTGGGALWLSLAALAALVVVACLALAWSPAIATPGPSPRLHVTSTVLRSLALGGLGIGLGATVVAQSFTDPSTGVTSFPRWGGVVVGIGGALTVAWWAVGTRWLRGAGGRGSAFRVGDHEVPDVSITVANGALLVGSVLVGLAAHVVSGGLVVTDAYLSPAIGVTPGATPLLAGVDRMLPGVFTTPYLPVLVLALAQVVLIVVLATASWERTPQVRQDGSPLDDGTPVVGNLVAVVVALLSLLLVTAVGAGLHALVLDALGETVAASEHAGFGGDTVQLVLPWWYGLTALVLAATPFVGFVAWHVLARRRRELAPRADQVADHLDAAYRATDDAGGASGPRADDPRLADIGRAWLTQRMIRDAGAVLVWTVVPLLVGAVAAVVFLARRVEGLAGPLPLLPIATAAVAAIPVGAVFLIRSSMRDRNARRDVGRLWDVVTFWPRVTHPFAPPCYAEGLVPMLEARVERLLTATRRQPVTDRATGRPVAAAAVPLRYRVILAGHSQGSVICLAVAARLGEDAVTSGDRVVDVRPARERPVALVTYGSPIAILYERYFRATLRAADGGWVHDQVCGAVHGWHHFCGLTEPFAFPFWGDRDDPTVRDLARAGWPVTSGLPGVHAACELCDGGDTGPRRVERVVCDPPRWQRWDGGVVPTGGHSVYHRDPQVDGHLARIAASLATTPVETTAPGDERRASSWWRTPV